MEVEEILAHPLVALSIVGSAMLSIVPGLEPLWQFLGATSGTWFPLVAVFSGTILPNIGYAELGTTLLLGGGIVYVAVYLDRFIDRIQEYLDR